MSKELFQQMREQNFDIDCSGQLYNEFPYLRELKQNLKVTVTNFGNFYKAELDGEKINREQLLDILGIHNEGSYRLEFHLDKFAERTNKYNVDYTEIDVT